MGRTRLKASSGSRPRPRPVRRGSLLATAVGALALAGLLGAVPPSALASFSPSFVARTADSRAGAFSPETVTITRNEGSEELGSVVVENPPGLLGALSAVGICPGARAEAGNCPATSQVGSVTVGLGPSFSPLYDEGGVYLTGPYKGAPFGLALEVPVLVGLFDFGEVVTRASLSIDPSTASLRIASDPLPQSFDGFPLEIRTIHLDLNRKGFTFNPTSCRGRAIEAVVTSTSGAVSSGSSPFRPTGCAKLAFAPKLDLRLAGQTNRGGHPKLTTVLRIPPGSANLKRIALTLPPTELVDSAHIKTPCTGTQFAAGQCPPASAIGFARVVTPVLRKPLQGPVYLRSSGRPLPDLAIALHGEVGLDLAGRIDSLHGGGLRVDFANLPDVPIAKLTLTLESGHRGLLVNSANLCRKPAQAAARLGGQNGAGAKRKVPLRAPCPKG